MKNIQTTSVKDFFLESILPNFHFSGFPIFAGKLIGVFVTLGKKCIMQLKNDLAYQRKTEKFFVYEEKKFGRIDSRSSHDRL